MGFLTLALLLMHLPLKPDYFLKNYILGFSSTLLCLRKKGLLVQSPPLNFPVHPHQPGDYVLIKTWKENKLEAVWDRPFLVLLTMETAIQTTEWGWTHHTLVKKVPSPDQKEQCAVLSHPGNTKVTLRRLELKYSFPFIWEMVCLLLM
jgi:hypothetical protein